MTARTATTWLVLGIACFVAGAALAILGDGIWWRLLGVLLYAPAIGLTIWAGRARRAARDVRGPELNDEARQLRGLDG